MTSVFIPIVVLGVLLLLVSIGAMVGSQAAARRQGKGFPSDEGGRSYPPSSPSPSTRSSESKGWQGLTCIAIGAVVPISCFWFAVKLVLLTPAAPRFDSELILILAFLFIMIGVGGLISGSILAYRLLGSQNQPGRLNTDKPPFDPNSLDALEAYDVAGRHD